MKLKTFFKIAVWVILGIGGYFGATELYADHAGEAFVFGLILGPFVKDFGEMVADYLFVVGK